MTFWDFAHKHTIVTVAMTIMLLAIIAGTIAAVVGGFKDNETMITGGLSIAGGLPALILFGLGLGWTMENGF